MGVPSFYRWLTTKYKSIVVNAKEEIGELCIDSSLPNPNGMEFDHFYLDMNGIIHACFHPEDYDHVKMCTPKTFDEVFSNVFGHIDRLFNIVRPRRLLYLAIDGVAPRAKMNQQRARRFRKAKEAEEMEKEEERLGIQFQLEGKQVLPRQETEVSDSNIITPGTEFMFRLSKELQSYIRLRMKQHPGWKNVKVNYFSFIRLQRTFPEYDPHTRHCVYGLDADLILLALATHEIHFSILRDVSSKIFLLLVLTCYVLGYLNSLICCCCVYTEQFLHAWILREYLEIDMDISNCPENFEPDFERLVDDFIFICFLSGNDFLPHMPSLYINEGGMDLLIHVYRTEFKNFGGYLLDMQRVEDQKSGYIKLKRVEKFILLVGKYEEQIFRRRADLRERKLRKFFNEYENSRCAEDQGLGYSEENNRSSNRPEVIFQNTKEMTEKLKANIRKAADSFQNGDPGTDEVKLNLPGYKERYYKEKFGVTNSSDIESSRRAVVAKYTEGLCWVTLCYFSGVPSWSWYYPYYYGPFASDMTGISQVKPKFQTGSPFKPFEQLMAVLPPRSAHALPLPYRRLMTDENSSIIDFYPTDFSIDVDGLRFTYGLCILYSFNMFVKFLNVFNFVKGVCKLPFIEEDRLLAETQKLNTELKVDEAIRNSEGLDLLFLGSSEIICDNLSNDSNKHDNDVKIDADLSEGLNGFVLPKRDGNKAVRTAHYDDDILCVSYKLPPKRKHNPRPLEGVIIPNKTIYKDYIYETQLWHEYQGFRPNTRIQNPHWQSKTDEKLTDLTSRGTPHNFNSPLHHNNNENWRGSSWDRGTTRVTEAIKPNEQQLYNDNMSFSKRHGSGNVWRAKSSARFEAQDAWISTSGGANKNVWQDLDSDTEESDLGHVEQLAVKFTEQLERRKSMRKCSGFKWADF
ncbi:hypothetical protein ACET3Z_006185 [Daucus carota]